MLDDVRHAWRVWCRHPTIAAGVVLPLGVALALSTALFSLLDGVWFRPLPFPRPAEIVAIDYRPAPDGSVPDLAYAPHLGDARMALRDRVDRSPLLQGRTQAGFATLFSQEAADLRMNATGVDARFFAVFDLRPVLGRVLTGDDEQHPAARSRESLAPLPVVIGHDVWRDMFGASPEVLGVHELAGRTVEVVGVLGPGVKFPEETNVWFPVSAMRHRPPAYARMQPGVTHDQVAAAFPELSVAPLRDAVGAGRAGALPLLFGASLVLLLVAGIQAGALLVSRTISRWHEIGVRLALGASVGRLWRQPIVENTCLAAIAGTAALLTVPTLTRFFAATLPQDITRGHYVAPDYRVWLFGAGLTLAGVVALSLFPLSVIHRTAATGSLTGRLGAASVNPHRVRRVLLVAQATVTAGLLYVSGLAAHSAARAVAFDYGFEAEHLTIFRPPPVRAAQQDFAAAWRGRNERMVDSVEVLNALPGVAGAAQFAWPPLAPDTRGSSAYREAIVAFKGQRLNTVVEARRNAVGVTGIRTLGARLTAGQDFEAPEYAATEAVAIVNESLARRLAPTWDLPGASVTVSVVGQNIQTQFFSGRIIGIVRDLVDASPAVASDPQFYTPTHSGNAAQVIAVRLRPDDRMAETTVRTTLERIWGQRGLSLRPVTDDLDRTTWPYRSLALALAIIAFACLPLAALGLTSAVRYSVQAGEKDLAIRLALGAQPQQLQRMTVRAVLTPVAFGVAVGFGGGIVAGQFIQAHLLHVHPLDVVSLVAASGVLLSLLWIAAHLPARRVGLVDPGLVLKDR